MTVNCRTSDLEVLLLLGATIEGGCEDPRKIRHGFRELLMDYYHEKNFRYSFRVVLLDSIFLQS